MTREQQREIEFFTGPEIQKVPELSPDGKFYIIYLPSKFKLRPCESIILNLQLKIKLPDGIQGIIGFLPSLTLQKLSIENFKGITLQTKGEHIKLEFLNRNVHDAIKIKKNQEISGK